MVEPAGFVDREAELALLDRLWDSGGPGLVVVYGRRRVGKTRLILEWLSGKPHAYYQAGLWSGRANIEGLAAALEEQLGLGPLSSAVFPDLKTLLGMASRLLGDRRVALVLDEFTYWLRVSPGVSGDLQWFVDHVLPGTRMLVVVSGSIVGLMERHLLGGGASLYGRASARVRLGELSPWCLTYFAPRYPPEELVRLYSLVGGVPYYLRLIQDDRPALQGFLELFGPTGPLADEPIFIFKDEFRDPHPYLSLAMGLASGPTGLGKAASRAGIPVSHATRYMSTLASIGLVSVETPLFSRRRIYRLRDKLLSAWLNIVHPLQHLLYNPTSQALRRASERAEKVAAHAWEEIAAHHALTTLSRRLELQPSLAGRVVHRGSEIDYLLVDEEKGEMLAIEAKWAGLEARELSRIASELRAKVYSTVPSRYRGFKLHTAIYARKVSGGETGEAVVVTPGDLPWGQECTLARHHGLTGGHDRALEA